MLRRTCLCASTLVRIGRGPGKVTEKASNELLEALQNHGYCYIQHPFIQKSVLDQVRRDCKRFFEVSVPALSEFSKESLKAPNGFRGLYRYVGASGIDDSIECFSMGRDDVEDPSVLRRDYYVQAGWEEKEFLPLISRKNPWEHVHDEQFRDSMTAYYELCCEVSMDVLRHISCGLGIRASNPQGDVDPEDGGEYDLEFFTEFHSNLDHDLQAKHYPAFGSVARKSVVDVTGASARNPKGAKVLRRKDAIASPLTNAGGSGEDGAVPPVRLDTHKDLSTITLLAQDVMGGLEVYDDEQEKFIEVPVLDDALMVNAGRFLEEWTGGLIQATPHRVRTTGTKNRCSVVFFCFPNYSAPIEPLLQPDENPAVDAKEGCLAGDMMPVDK